MYSLTAASSQKITWPHVTAIDGATQFSLSCYANFKSGNLPFRFYIGQINAGVSAGWCIIEFNNGTELLIAARNGGSGYKTFVVPRNQVVALVLRFEGSAAIGNRLRLWIDGSEVSGTPSGTIDTSIGTDTDLFIIGTDTPGGNFTSCDFAEVALWPGYLLTDAEISAHFKGQIATGISPQNLNFYAPLARNLGDVVGGLTGSPDNSPSVIPQPRRYG